MAQAAFVAPSALVDGQSQLDSGASVWPHAQVIASVIGEKSNIQDNARIIRSQIGPGVTVGHNAVIEDSVIHGPGLVAMNAVVKKSVLEPWSAVGANAVVENETVPSYTLWVGKTRNERNPRSLLKPEELALIRRGAAALRPYSAPLHIHRRLIIKPIGRALFNYPEYVKLSKDYQQILGALNKSPDVMEMLGYRLKKEGANIVRQLMQVFDTPYSDAMAHLITLSEKGVYILPYFKTFGQSATRNPQSAIPNLQSAIELLWPRIEASAQLAPGVCVFGNVRIGANSICESGVSLRGDYDQITIGSGVHIYAHASIHTNFERPCVIEDAASIGEGTVVHACTVRQKARVGTHVTLLDGSSVEAEAQTPNDVVLGYDKIFPAKTA